MAILLCAIHLTEYRIPAIIAEPSKGTKAGKYPKSNFS